MEHLTFIGEVNTEMLPPVVAMYQTGLLYTPTECLVSGPGGDFMVASGIIDLLRWSPETTTIAFGEVVSASMLIAITGDRRIALEGTIYGLHEPFVSGEYEDPASLRSDEQLINIMRRRFYYLMDKRTKMNWEPILRDRTMLWLTAEEAKDRHLVDEVLHL